MVAVRICAVFAAMTALNSGSAFGAVRETMDISSAAGVAWTELVADTLDFEGGIPSGDWKPSAMPTKVGWKTLNSEDRNFMYSTHPVDKYFEADGTFKKKTRRSIWFKGVIDIPAERLGRGTVRLTASQAGYKAGLFVNGRFAGESIFSTLPRDWDITAFVKPGRNELVFGCTVREGLVDPVKKFYRAPSNGGVLGVVGPVEIEFRPFVTISDVFVRTFVTAKRIETDVTVKNEGTKSVRVKPEVTVTLDAYRERVVTAYAGEEIEVPAHGERTVTLKKDWIADQLWSPEKPALYVAHVKAGAAEREQTFGFREVARKGKDILLNGRRVALIRQSSLFGMAPQGEMSGENQVIRALGTANCVRQHLGLCNEAQLYAADRVGMLMTPESAYSWKACFPMDERVDLWLPGVLDYYGEWIRRMRNHPSVIMYNLDNETYWASTNATDMAVTAKLAARARELDPTRLIEADGDNGWGKSTDVINVHYPEGQAGTLRLKYMNASCIVPNDFDWLTEKGGHGWCTDFEWDRPLFLGEFGMGLSDDNYSSVVGDAYYTWGKWQGRTVCEDNDGSYGFSEDNPFMCFLRDRITSLRDKGVAALNPWGGDFRHVIRKKDVRPLEFGRNFASGGTFARTYAVFNDDLGDGRVLEGIDWQFRLDGVLLTNGFAWCGARVGEHKRVRIEIPLPKTVRPVRGEIQVRAIHLRGKVHKEDAACRDAFTVFPKVPRPALSGNVRVIGRDRLDFTKTKELDEFVKGGGVALVLPQKDWKPWRPDLPERDPLHAQSKCWIRMKDHPAFAGMDDASVSFWGKDNVVTYETFVKPTTGHVAPLLECGGRYGVNWSPLLESAYGKGLYILTTLELDADDPGAKWLLGNLIAYANGRAPAERSALNILAGCNAALSSAIALTGAVTSEGLGTKGPVLVDASAAFKAADLASALAAGRDVWLHGFDDRTFAKVAALFPEGARLVPAPKEILAGEPVSAHPFVRGLSAFDLAWYRRSWMPGHSLFENAALQAKAGDWVLETEWFDGTAERLTAPAFLAAIPRGKGRILMDTLLWEKATEKEPEKAMRVCSLLATNLGCGFRFAPKKFYRYDHVDLLPAANMGYADEYKGDGKGGWLDDGRADMRFFLINHVGTGGGEFGGMAVDTEKFPGEVRFNDVKFHLEDPRDRGGKAIVAFGSDKAPSIKLRETGELPVGKTADVLWFLHATGWGRGKAPAAKVSVTYADGTKWAFDLVNEVDVGDWFTLKKYANCQVAWAGKNLVSPSVGLYMCPKANPHPGKTIRSISVKGCPENSQYVLVAIALATEDASQTSLVAPRDKSYLKVDFREPEKCPLPTAGKASDHPEKTAEGLRYRHGQQNGWALPAEERKTCLAEPYGVLLDFTPEEPPDGWCAGLVNLGPVRITLRQNNPCVVFEGWHEGKRIYVQSKEPVIYGKRVRFEFVNDGKTLKLYRDDRLDAMAPASLETDRECSFVSFGVAGGQKYYFNGVMHAAEFYKVAQ